MAVPHRLAGGGGASRLGVDVDRDQLHGLNHVRMICPAAGPGPQARCKLKPKSEGGSGKVKTRIPVTDVLAAHPPKVCTQQSITLPPEEGAKYAQELPTKPRSGTPGTPSCVTPTRA